MFWYDQECFWTYKDASFEKEKRKIYRINDWKTCMNKMIGALNQVACRIVWNSKSIGLKLSKAIQYEKEAQVDMLANVAVLTN